MSKFEGLTEEEQNELLALREESEGVVWRLAETASRIVKRLKAQGVPLMNAYRVVGDFVAKSPGSIRFYCRGWEFWTAYCNTQGVTINSLRESHPLLGFTHFEAIARAATAAAKKHGRDPYAVASALLEWVGEFVGEYGVPPKSDFPRHVVTESGDVPPYKSAAAENLKTEIPRSAAERLTEAIRKAAASGNLDSLTLQTAAEALQDAAQTAANAAQILQGAIPDTQAVFRAAETLRVTAEILAKQAAEASKKEQAEAVAAKAAAAAEEKDKKSAIAALEEELEL